MIILLKNLHGFHLWNRPPLSSFLNCLSKAFFNHLGRLLSWIPLIRKCCFLFNHSKFYVALNCTLVCIYLWKWNYFGNQNRIDSLLSGHLISCIHTWISLFTLILLVMYYSFGKVHPYLHYFHTFIEIDFIDLINLLKTEPKSHLAHWLCIW